MILDFFRAVLLAGVPVFLASYLLVLWALRHRKLGAVTSLRAMQRELKRQSKESKKQKKEARKKGTTQVFAEGAHLSLRGMANPVHAKWLAFGGGFYGVVGLLTYALVELREIWDFLVGFESIWALLSGFGLDMLIDLLVGAVKNFVVAIAWPAYWLSGIRSDFAWMWILVAYGAYWAGARLAMRRFSPAAPEPAAGSE